MAVVVSSLFKNTALGSAVYSDRAASRIDQLYTEADEAHRGIFPWETGILFCCQYEALATNGPPVECKRWARVSQTPVGPRLQDGSAAGMESGFLFFHMWKGERPAVQKEHTGSTPPRSL